MNEKEILNLCLEQLHDLVYSFEEAKEMDMLPESFFEENEERIQTLGSLFNELGSSEKESLPTTTVQEEMIVEEPKAKQTSVLVEDQIARTIYADLNKSLSLNDRFRFQRELFGNDAQQMDEALTHLNSLSSYDEAYSYLSESFNWDWEAEATIAFKELLQKRFS